MIDSLTWMTRALCRGRDPNDYAKPDMVKMNSELAKKYAQVADDCFDCPVFFQCEQDASQYGDQLNTIRAGSIPHDMRRGAGRPVGSTGSSMIERGECVKGHKIKSEADLTSRKTCLACKDELNANRRNSRCQNGHLWTDENTAWVGRPGGKKYRRCRECTRVYERDRYQERSAAKKSTTMAA